MNRFHFSCFGVPIELATFDPLFKQHVEQQIQAWTTVATGQAASATDWQLKITHLKKPWQVKVGAYKCLGTDLLCNEESVWFKNRILPGLIYQLDVKDKTVEVLCCHEYTLSQRVKVMAKKGIKQDFLALYFYLFFLYPLLVILAAKDQAVPIHASALALGEKTVAFCGLDGVGKSTLLLQALAAFPKAQFVADNLLPICPDATLGLPTPVRIDPNNRYVPDLNEEMVSKKAVTQCKPITHLFFPAFAEQWRIAPITQKKALANLQKIENLVSELVDFMAFVSLVSNIEPLAIALHDKTETLTTILENARAYELELPKETSVSAVYDHLEKVLT